MPRKLQGPAGARHQSPAEPQGLAEPQGQRLAEPQGQRPAEPQGQRPAEPQGQRPAGTPAQVRAEAQAAAMWAGDRATQGLGITLSGIGPGRATATMTVTAGQLNGHGSCHGGYLFLLADTAFAFACNTRGDAAVASGADVSFLAPVGEGDVLVAEAVERVVRGRSGLYDVTVRRGDEPVLEFRGRSRTVPPPPPPASPGPRV